MLQSLVRTTGSGNPGLVQTEALGFGIVSLENMLADNPTAYEKVNPLVFSDGPRCEGDLSAQEIEQAVTPTALDPMRQGGQPPSTATASSSLPSPVAADGGPGQGAPVWVWGAGAAVVVVLVGVVVFVVVRGRGGKG
jgi:hypothetical protein